VRDGHSHNQPQARLSVGGDPYHPGTTLYLLVEALEAVGDMDVPPMMLREGEVSETLLDVLSKMLSQRFAMTLDQGTLLL